MGSDDAFLAGDDRAQAEGEPTVEEEAMGEHPDAPDAAALAGPPADSEPVDFEITHVPFVVEPGRIVRFRPAGTEDVWLPALVLTVPGELSKADALVTGAWNWPDPPLEGCVHLAVFQPHADRQVELEVNVPEGEGERCWKWPAR